MPPRTRGTADGGACWPTCGCPAGRDLGYQLIAGGFGKAYVYETPFSRLSAYRRAEATGRRLRAQPLELRAGAAAGRHARRSVRSELHRVLRAALRPGRRRLRGHSGDRCGWSARAYPHRLDGDGDRVRLRVVARRPPDWRARAHAAPAPSQRIAWAGSSRWIPSTSLDEITVPASKNAHDALLGNRGEVAAPAGGTSPAAALELVVELVEARDRRRADEQRLRRATVRAAAAARRRCRRASRRPPRSRPPRR